MQGGKFFLTQNNHLLKYILKMREKLLHLIKYIVLLVSIILLVVLCLVFLNFNNAVIEEKNTPVHITPAVEKTAPKKVLPSKPPVIKKPMTRDQNDMPKSDYKVPEIG